MRIRAGRLAAATVALACALSASPSRAAEIPVDLELALAIDVSGSVDFEEARLQREGYIAAFRNPRVIRAIRGGPYGRIAVLYYEWAGFGHMRVIVPWTLVDSEQASFAVADALGRDPPQTARRTAIAAAIDFGAASFDNNGFEGRRRVIDISGDGPNNWGDPVTEARDRAVRKGVTINGLPILDDTHSLGGLPPTPNLDIYYQNCVIGGPGSFVVVARDFRSFADAVLRKMVLEIAGLRPTAPAIARGARLLRGMPAHRLVASRDLRRIAEPREGPPCDIGERQWNRRWGIER